jgi:hypothetical protein
MKGSVHYDTPFYAVYDNWLPVEFAAWNNPCKDRSNYYNAEDYYQVMGNGEF